MDLFPLYNSVRIALVATAAVFFAGICLAFYVAKLPPLVKGLCDAVLTVPLVLPPTVTGFLLLRLLSPNRGLGAFLLENFDARLVMTWQAAALASAAVAFPLMYRTARGAFEAFDRDVEDAARTLGLSGTYIFWRIRLPCCRTGIAAGLVLAFARALGEYGATSMVAGYTPGVTATVSTAVYNFWRTGDDARAFAWVGVNLALSCAALLALSRFEKSPGYGGSKT